jgi:hypothetical protein
VFFPSPGSVPFTLLALAIFFWLQSVGAFGLLAPTSVPASTSAIPYQGRLANTSGIPLNGSYPITFSSYSVASGGSPLWTESWSGPNSVSVSDGLFNVMLGSLTPLPHNIVTGNGSLRLGLTVNTDDEMAPRVRLGTVPYTIFALNIADSTVSTAKLVDGAVTSRKFNPTRGIATAIGSLALNTSYQDVPGTSVTINLDTPQTLMVVAVLDMRIPPTAFDANGELNIDGTLIGGAAFSVGEGSGDNHRMNVVTILDSR